MQDIVLAVIDQLLANTAVAGQVGSNIYRGTLPPSPPYPSVVIDRVTKIREAGNNTAHYATARVQCTVFTQSDGLADTISETIADCLHSTTNTFMNNVYVIRIEDAGGAPDNSDALTLGIFRDHRDFLIFYSAK
jgi:hypothetical protein